MDKEKAQSLDLMTYLHVIKTWRRELLFFVIIVAGVTLAVSLVLPKTFYAKTTILPMQSGQGGIGSMLMNQPGAVAILGGAGLSLDSGSSRIMAALESRTVAESVIDQLGLATVFFPKEWEDAKKSSELDQRKIKNAMYQFYIDEVVTIMTIPEEVVTTIAAVAPTPELAASIANTHVAKTKEFLETKNFSAASRERKFIEEQHKRSLLDLSRAEDAFRVFQEQNNILVADTQTEVTLKYLSELEAEILNKRIRMNYLINSSRGSNPEVQQLKEQIAVIEKEISKLSAPVAPEELKNINPERTIKPLHVLTELGQRYLQHKREVLVLEKVGALLTEQLELAKIKEQQALENFEVVDPALVPTEKYFPKVKKMVAIAIILSLFMGTLGIFILDSLGIKRKSPVSENDQKGDKPQFDVYSA